MSYNIGDLLELKMSREITAYRANQPPYPRDYENGEKGDLYLITDYITFYCDSYDEKRTGWLLCSQKSSTKSFWPQVEKNGVVLDFLRHHFIKVG
jgi:hypothetical protein